VGESRDTEKGGGESIIWVENGEKTVHWVFKKEKGMIYKREVGGKREKGSLLKGGGSNARGAHGGSKNQKLGGERNKDLFGRIVKKTRKKEYGGISFT